MKKNWWRWALVVLCIGVIFCFSAQTGEESGRLSGGISQWVAERVTPNWKSLEEVVREELLKTWRFIIRKSAHLTEFAVLGTLLFNAWAGNVYVLWRRVSLSAACSFLVAASDEFHQVFVPARGPSLQDVFIDFTGAMLGILLVCLVCWAVRKCRKRKETHAFS